MTLLLRIFVIVSQVSIYYASKVMVKLRNTNQASSVVPTAWRSFAWSPLHWSHCERDATRPTTRIYISSDDNWEISRKHIWVSRSQCDVPFGCMQTYSPQVMLRIVTDGANLITEGESKTARGGTCPARSKYMPLALVTAQRSALCVRGWRQVLRWL